MPALKLVGANWLEWLLQCFNFETVVCALPEELPVLMTDMQVFG
jgi:hypothetical protein